MSSRLLVCVLFCVAFASCGKDKRVSKGAQIYATNCAICHGADLRGGGGAGVSGLNKVPSDLTQLAFMAQGEFPTGRVVDVLHNYAHGTQPGRKMRPFPELRTASTQRIKTQSGRVSVPQSQAALIAYLKSKQRP